MHAQFVTEISVIDESWFQILARRKRELKSKRQGSPNSRLIAVFGGSAPVKDSRQYTDAFLIGAELAKRGAIVFNGGYGGVMDASAAGAQSEGGISVGVTCDNIPEGKLSDSLTHEWHVDRWDQRLFALVFLADGYAVMPGSSGTLVELSMVIETQMKGFIPERPVVCFGRYWQPVVKRIAGTKVAIKFSGKPDRVADILARE